MRNRRLLRPVLLTVLGRVGILSSAQLRGMRRHAYVGIIVPATIVTPPDGFSMIRLIVPLVLLYEISIWCARMFEAQRESEPAA